MVTQQLIEAKSPMRGIELISIAIKKLQTDDSQLTMVHADLCQLCLLAKCFKPALKFLDIDITAIATQEVCLYSINIYSICFINIFSIF